MPTLPGPAVIQGPSTLPDPTGKQKRVLAVGSGDVPFWASDIRGIADGDATGANVEFDDASAPNGGDFNGRGGLGGVGGIGGAANVVAGTGDNLNKQGAELNLHPGTVTAHGGAAFKIKNSLGQSGEAIVSDGDNNIVYGGAQSGAGAPSAAPDRFLPFYFDTTAVTGGLYMWVGAAWVKVSVAP